MLNDNPALDRVVYGITPTFSIYQANGQKKQGLKKAFVDVIKLYGNEDTIIIADGSKWPLIFETEQHVVPTKFIVSFQVYEDGRYYAVARLYKDKVKV